MPHPNQQAHEDVPPAVDEPQNNGHRSVSGYATSNGHVTTESKDQSVAVGPEVHLVDVAALIAENEGLRQRLASQPVIEQSKGILMGHYGISSDTAFQLLCRWSQDTNTKLRRIAELLTDTTGHSPGIRPAPHQIVQQDSPSNDAATWSDPSRTRGVHR